MDEQVVKVNSLNDELLNSVDKHKTKIEFICCNCGKTSVISFSSFSRKDKLWCSTCVRLSKRDESVIQAKIRETNIKKRGVPSNFCTLSKERKARGELLGAANPDIKKKMAKTNKERRGIDSSSTFGLKEVKDKVKNTLLERYGVDHNFKIPEFINKRAEEAIKRNQKYRNSDNYKDFFIKRYIEPKDLKVNNTYIKDNELYYNITCNKCSKTFEWSIFDRISGGVQYPYCTDCCHNGTSYEEDEVYDFVKSIYDGPIIRNDRQQLEGKEIDIYLPEKKFGIEYNGLYWHAGDKKRHREKWELAQKKEIDLMQIWSCEWETKRHILESIIKNRLGLAEPIYARKCHVKEVPVKEARKFADENHMQGFYHGMYVGLYYKDELIDMSIYCEARFGGHYSWELTRHVIKHGLRVIGGLSRELAYFRKTGHHGDIVDYCDMRLFNGKGHWGFEEVGITPPDMQYTDFVRVIPRGKYQKRNMKNIPGFKFDPNKTQLENLHDNGMDFIYGVGHKIFVNREEEAVN